MKTLLFVFVIAMLEPVFAQPVVKGSFAEPVGAELDKFPLKPGPLSAKEREALGLSLRRLYKPTMVENHRRDVRPDDHGRFTLEILPPDTPVLVDKSGKLRYKADCGNRIVEVASCPQCPTIGGGAGSKSSNTLKDDGKRTAGKSFMQSLIDDAQAAAARIWNFLWDILKWMFWALAHVIGCGLIAAIAVGLYLLARDTINRWRHPGPTSPTVATPVSQQTAQTAAAIPSTPEPVVTPVPPTESATEPASQTKRTTMFRAVPARGAFGPTQTENTEQDTPAPKRRLRVEVSDDGNFYTKMKGYRSILVEEDFDGNLIIRTDPRR